MKVNIIITLNGDWTDRIETIRRIEHIPSETICLGMYSETINTTKLYITYNEEREVNAK